MNKITIGIAGSTYHTQLCAEPFLNDERFKVEFVLTPSPKAIGRQQVITPNPLHQWAESHSIPFFLIEKKIDEKTKKFISEHIILLKKNRLDFLLVVDFGYIIPQWLLEMPTAALNVHPSLLPKWRGSSPGQFILLSGETESAVSLIQMTQEIDSGPLVAQIPFQVDQTWNQSEYYLTSFHTIAVRLPEFLSQFSQGTLTPSPQNTLSPTPIARRLRRDDGYVSWALVRCALQPAQIPQPADLAELKLHPLLAQFYDPKEGIVPLLERASRAFAHWPGLWTVLHTHKGEKRLKILKTRVNSRGALELEQVQIDGQNPHPWNEIKNIVNQ